MGGVGGINRSIGQANFSAFVLIGMMMLSGKAKETLRFFSFFINMVQSRR